MEERLRWQRIQKYGPASEKLSDAQLELLELEPGVSNLEVQAESAREPLPPRTRTQRPRPHPGRQELPADTVISKYSDHLPLYRQSVMLERETGLEISRATLDGGVMTVGGLLIPWAAAMGRELVVGTYRQADETPVDVQMHDRRGHNHQAYLWQYSRPGGSVVFDFQWGRGRDGPKKFLAGFNGILQTDGYAAYNKVGGPKLVHAACWTHSRRKFYEAHQVCPGESVAQGIVLLLNDMFGIDVEASAQIWIWPRAIGCASSKRGRCWRRSGRRSKQRVSRLCRPASWAARSPTRWGCGSGSSSSWITRNWS